VEIRCWENGKIEERELSKVSTRGGGGGGGGDAPGRHLKMTTWWGCTYGLGGVSICVNTLFLKAKGHRPSRNLGTWGSENWRGIATTGKLFASFKGFIKKRGEWKGDVLPNKEAFGLAA